MTGQPTGQLDRDDMGDAQRLAADRRVAVWRGTPSYPALAPFSPDARYPESPFGDVGDQTNSAYQGVRESLRMLGLDSARFGRPDWNPLGTFIRPGERVVIKPNFVLSRHQGGGDIFSIITHPAVLRAVVDYVYLAVGGTGTITIADAPQMDCDFQELVSLSQLSELQSFYRGRAGFELRIVDLRPFWCDPKLGDRAALQENRHQLPGDPAGSVTIDMARRSAFAEVENWDRFYGADYDRKETIALHHGEVQRYSISKTVLDADVVVFVPKLKVHKKVGVTINCKGLVGITTNKNCLVHYRLGTPETGGDQFPSRLLTWRERTLTKAIRRTHDLLLARRSRTADRVYWALRSTYRAIIKPMIGGVDGRKSILDAGNWHGNDSAWRMVTDLTRILFFATPNGILESRPQRRMFSIVDGIVGGDLNGPLEPRAQPAGIIISGANPLTVDVVGTRLMGFDGTCLKWMQQLLLEGLGTRSAEIDLRSDDPEIANMFATTDPLLAFNPHPGWLGAIEIGATGTQDPLTASTRRRA